MANDRLEYDVLLIGAGPGNLALAHRLVQLKKERAEKGDTTPLSIAVLDKAKEFGGHNISGATSNPHVIKKLFPDYEELGFPIEGTCNESYFTILGQDKSFDIPNFVLPKELDKKGNVILSLSLVVAWMAKHLETVAKEVPTVAVDMFPGFAAHEVLYEGDTVVGVRVSNSGNPEEDNIYAKVTVLGDKGFISQDLITKFNLRKNPQIWSVGVKEVWEIQDDMEGKVWHTLGFPVLDGTFGGGFVYGMKNKRLTLGMVISLDSKNPNIHPQQRMQDLKKHPWMQKILKGGKLLKYGAAVLPEGGYYSLPEKFAVNGALLTGDALGVLNVMKLAGIDLSMETGYQGAETLLEAFDKQDFSENTLKNYKERLNNTFVMKDLYKSRYFRYAFMQNEKLLGEYLPKMSAAIDGPGAILGGLSIGLSDPNAPFAALKAKQFIEGGVDIGPISYKPCHQHIVAEFSYTPETNQNFDKNTIYSREDAVFYANPKYHHGNEHIDEFNADVCLKCIAKYDALGKTTPCVSDCTAEVHRVDDINNQRKHGMSLENCVQCRTCEIVCPEENLRVNPAYQGSGPDYMGL